MNHARARGLLADYLEGDLDLSERAELDRHLAECPSCNEEVRSLRGLVGLLRGLPDPGPQVDLADAVMQRIAAGEGRPLLRLDRATLRHGMLPRLVGTLAAGVAGLALVTSFLGEESGPVVDESAPKPITIAQQVEAPGDEARAKSRPSLPSPSPGVRTPTPTSIRLARGARRIEPRLELRSRRLPTRRRTPSAFGAWVAPPPELLELGDASAQIEVDRQLDWLRRDPISFLRRTGGPGTDRYSRLTRRAASRGVAGEVAGRLMSVHLPEANQLAGQMLLEALASDVSRR